MTVHAEGSHVTKGERQFWYVVAAVCFPLNLYFTYCR